MMHVIAPSTTSSERFCTIIFGPYRTETSSRRAQSAMSVCAEENVRKGEIEDEDQDDRGNHGAGRRPADAGGSAPRLKALVRPDDRDDHPEHCRLEEPFEDVVERYCRARRGDERLL